MANINNIQLMIRKYLDIIGINIFFPLVGGILFVYYGQKVEILGAFIATGISLSLGVRQYKTENDKLFKELFIEFNSKYDKVFNEVLQLIVEKYETDSNYKMTPSQEKFIVDYINFCAEEYLWRTKGRIPKSVWDSWENGMIYYLNKPLINEVVIKEKGQKDSYYGLYKKLEKKIKNLS